MRLNAYKLHLFSILTLCWEPWISSEFLNIFVDLLFNAIFRRYKIFMMLWMWHNFELPRNKSLPPANRFHNSENYDKFHEEDLTEFERPNDYIWKKTQIISSLIKHHNIMIFRWKALFENLVTISIYWCHFWDIKQHWFNMLCHCKLLSTITKQEEDKNQNHVLRYLFYYTLAQFFQVNPWNSFESAIHISNGLLKKSQFLTSFLH